MNKKYIKENKKAIREFLGGILGAVLAGRVSVDMDKEIKKNPELMKQRDKLKTAASQMEKTAREMAKKYPEKVPALRKYYKKFGIKI